MYLLDTNACIQFLRNRHALVVHVWSAAHVAPPFKDGVLAQLAVGPEAQVPAVRGQLGHEYLVAGMRLRGQAGDPSPKFWIR